MSRLVPLALSLACLSAVAAPLVQERVKKKKPADFQSIHAALGESWKAGQYGRAQRQCRELAGLIAQKRVEVVLAALPAAPAGYEIVQDERSKQNAQNPMAAAMMASVGQVIERRYQSKEKGDRIDVTLTVDSPLAQMFAMWVQNPAMLGEEAELVRYGEHTAILKKEGAGWNLQILLGETLVEVKSRKATDDELLALFDQAAIDRLDAALSK